MAELGWSVFNTCAFVSQTVTTIRQATHTLSNNGYSEQGARVMGLIPGHEKINLKHRTTKLTQ